MRYVVMGLCLLVIALAVLVIWRRSRPADLIHPKVNLKVTSSAFEQGGAIPAKYTGQGEDVSPPLEVHDLSKDAKTIAVIMDDLDHPIGAYNHWVIWNIPAGTEIDEAVPHGKTLEALGGAVQGRSEYGGKHYYRGPLPPFGKHSYEFKVYVLDTVLDLSTDAGKAALQRAMDGHVLQFGTILGTFGQ